MAPNLNENAEACATAFARAPGWTGWAKPTCAMRTGDSFAAIYLLRAFDFFVSIAFAAPLRRILVSTTSR